MNQDFRDIIGALQRHGVEFLVVGAHALAAHGIVRATGDLDIWIKRSPENARRVWAALAEFGAPLGQLAQEDFTTAQQVIQFGVAPTRIDILTDIDALVFDQAWPNRVEVDVEGLRVPILGRADLIRNKRATGRPKDQLDAEGLEQSEPAR